MTGYGPPSAYSSAPPPRPVAATGSTAPVFDLIGIVLGVLSIVWGFLDWYGSSGNFTYKGFATTGAGAIGLSVLAAAAAAFALLDREAKGTVVPAAASVAAVLVTAGLLVGKPSGEDAKVGLILQLITALLQAVMFVLGWLQAKGKIMQHPVNAPYPGPAWGGAPYSYPTHAADLPSQPLPFMPPYPGGGGYPPRPQYQQPYPPAAYPQPTSPPAPSHQPERQQAPSEPPYPSGQPESRTSYPPPSGEQSPPGQAGYPPHAGPYGG
jgi:hypothetical protein